MLARLLRILIALPIACFSSFAFAFGNDDFWVSGYGQGISEALIRKGPGNEIYVTCDEGAGREATGIRFMLGGSAPTGSTVTLTFNGEDPQQYSLWDGEVITSCHACASVYDAMIAKFKSKKTVHVLFENGDSTKFSLKGAKKAIGQCVADFYR